MLSKSFLSQHNQRLDVFNSFSCLAPIYIRVLSDRHPTLCQPGKYKGVLEQYTGRAKILDSGRQVSIIFNYTFLLMFLITEWLTLCLQYLWDRFFKYLLAL